MEISTYEQWLDLKRKSLKPGDYLSCSICDGGGVIYDTCHSCDHETETDCQECEGSGSITFADVSYEALGNHLTKKEYIEEVFRDLSALADYTNARALNIIAPFIIKLFSHRCDVSLFQMLCDAAKGRSSSIARRL